jgi:tRNA(Ile)-lysidine synthase
MKPEPSGAKGLPAHLDSLILDRKLLRPGQFILVAVSGGLDSMVLLTLLHELSRRTNWRLIVAHLNHQLRGRSSDEDEKLVSRVAERLGLRAIVERVDVRSLAVSRKLSLEMAARQARHEFLARTAVRLGIPSVALAHHADDQIELFFLRLLRGSSGEGLSGMNWQSPSPANKAVELVRPLLGFSKTDLRTFAMARGVPFREDASNACLDIQRNRIRHELLPLLSRRYQPSLARTITRVMDILGAEADAVSVAAERWLQRKRRTPYERLPVALQRRVVLLQLLRLRVDPDFDVVEYLRLHVGQPTSAPGGASVQRDRQGVVRKGREATAPFRKGFLKVHLQGKAGEFTFDSVNFAWKFVARKGIKNLRSRLGLECFDADKIGTAIYLRHWRPGDRFQPIGMSAAVKLQDLFVNQKVTRDRRRELIVATTHQGEIFWIEGLRISERFKLSPATIHRLQWRWQRP